MQMGPWHTEELPQRYASPQYCGSKRAAHRPCSAFLLVACAPDSASAFRSSSSAGRRSPASRNMARSSATVRASESPCTQHYRWVRAWRERSMMCSGTRLEAVLNRERMGPRQPQTGRCIASRLAFRSWQFTDTRCAPKAAATAAAAQRRPLPGGPCSRTAARTPRPPACCTHHRKSSHFQIVCCSLYD